MPVSMEGHRARMRLRAESIGAEHMRPQELVEMMLYYALPRRDTREQAHALIGAFGSVEGVLAASEQELTKVRGIGRRTAAWLRALGEMVEAYADLDAMDRPRINNMRRTDAFLSQFFQNADYPEVWQFSLNAGGRLLGGQRISDCAAWGEEEYLRDALSAALSSRAHSVLIGQYSPIPGDQFEHYDREHTIGYAKTLAAADIQLLDHVIIRPDGAHSMYAAGKLDQVRLWVENNSLREGYLLAEPEFDGYIYD